MGAGKIIICKTLVVRYVKYVIIYIFVTIRYNGITSFFDLHLI